MLKKVIFTLLAISGVALAYWAIAPRQLLTSDSAQDFDSYVRALADEEAIPGLAVAVVVDVPGTADWVKRRGSVTASETRVIRSANTDGWSHWSQNCSSRISEGNWANGLQMVH